MTDNAKCDQPEPSPPVVKGVFHTMAKPVGSTCNLDCTYCYYLHKESLLEQRRGQRMEPEILERFIQQYIAAQNGEEIVFAWQGGEPTLLGLEYFQQIIVLQQQYKPAGQRIVNTLQTNATLLTDKWCLFLKEHDFLVGVSIDGPKRLHDVYRLTRNQKPTFDSVMHGIALLKKHAVEFNTLTVINRLNAAYPLDVYRFLRDEVQPQVIQFIPCVEPKDFRTQAPQHWLMEQMPRVGSSAARPGTPDSIVAEWSVDPEKWGNFLCRTFDEWYKNDLGSVFVNLFETAVAQMMGLPAQLCTAAQYCGKALAIECDGSVFSCDHYVYPEYKLGNINQEHIGTLAFSARQQHFGRAKSESLPEYCKKCEHLSLCWGECPRNRFLQTPKGEPGLNYFCVGIKRFFNHAGPMLRKMARELAQ